MKSRKSQDKDTKRTQYQQRVADGIERMAPKRDVFAELLGLPRRPEKIEKEPPTSDTGGTGDTAATGTGDTGATAGITADAAGTGIPEIPKPDPITFIPDPDRKIEPSPSKRSASISAERPLRRSSDRKDLPQVNTATTGTGDTGATADDTGTSSWQRFAPREIAVLRVADAKASLDTGEFWCKSSEFMSLARLVNRNYFFDALKRLETRRILEVLVKYNGCRDGIKYKLNRTLIPPDIWELLASAAGPTGTGSTGDTGTGKTGTGTGVTAYIDHDHDLIDIDIDRDQIRQTKRIQSGSGREAILKNGAPTEVVQEFFQLTGQRWQPKFDLLWQELINRAESARIGYTIGDIIRTMRRATQSANSRPKSFKFYTVSLEREWGLQKKLASAVWEDICREAETNRELSDYTSKIEALKCKFAELGLAWDNDLITDVTRRRA